MTKFVMRINEFCNWKILPHLKWLSGFTWLVKLVLIKSKV